MQASVRWAWVLLAIVAAALVLAFLPGRTRIPPLIGSDYCYLLIAADRMYEGLGLTAPLPVAPFQQWTWHTDWSFLTRWPIGYPILICGLRWLFGLSSILACQWISTAACATALVGWYVWIRRCVPPGVTAVPLAAVAAGCSVSTSLLINPSTDAVLVALLPFVLLFTTQATCQRTAGTSTESPRRAGVWLLCAGLTAGGLFWIRYAAVFVPIAIMLYLIIERYRRPVITLRGIAVFASAAAAPIVTLLLINRAQSVGGSVQAQLNLGDTVRLDLSPRLLATAWWNFTDFGFYDYHWFAHWIYALWPLGVIVVALFVRPVRKAVRSFLDTPPVTLSACLVVTLLVMLALATAVFGDKFDYVGLDRYYTPVKPLYFVLFVAPILLIPRASEPRASARAVFRVVRTCMFVALLVGCSWLVRQEWPRPYTRWLNAERAVTPYGQWARCFTPGAADLHRWLSEQKAPDLIVVSNFHEFIALETGIPALPIPDSTGTLNTWVEDIRRARGVREPRVLFVLDPTNRWRDYWIKPPAQIIQTFGLTDRADAPPTISSHVLVYGGGGRALSTPPDPEQPAG